MSEPMLCLRSTTARGKPTAASRPLVDGALVLALRRPLMAGVEAS